MKISFALLFSLFVSTFISCNITSTETSWKEIKRISSLDKKAEAVLIETDGGATSSFGNLVFIIVPGKKITQNDLKYAVFNADHYQGLDMHWEVNRQLVISYNKARIFSYTNFWNSDEIDNWNYVVEIKLNCLSSDGQLSESDMHPMTR
jgi:hypothetical protein